MAALINQLSGLVGQAFSQGLGQNLVQAIPLSHAHPFWTPLYEALLSVSYERKELLADNRPHTMTSHQIG